MVTVENFRQYLRTPPDEHEDLQIYLQAAVSKARSAGIKDFQQNALYDQFILNYAGMLYDNRSMDLDTSKAKAMIDSFVLELRYAEDGQ